MSLANNSTLFEPVAKQALDPAIAQMQQRWQESGIPDLYEGGNGPVSRERGRNVRAVFYPKPKLAHAPIEAITIPGPAGEMQARIVRPLSGDPVGDGRGRACRHRGDARPPGPRGRR